MVIDDMPEIGKPGGDLKMLVARAKDVRLLYVYGHARLVNYDLDLNIIPDIVRDFTVEDGRVFTFELREGHKWSDGEPFTVEDFRFWWEDIANNAELMPSGIPIELIVDGEGPTVEFFDNKVVYSWEHPNPAFLTKLAAASPLFIYAPAHYLRQFHKAHADPGELEALIKQTNSRDWVQLFFRRERMNDFDLPELPTLQPWRLVTSPPAERFIAERNPHFHRVDSAGQQLPYIDRFILDVVDSKLIPIKTGAGETDLQTRGLFFKDYTFLKESEGRSGLRTLLWTQARGSHLAIYPNLNAADPVWRDIFRNREFRYALSIALDRNAVSQYLYYGLATPSNNTVIEASPLFTPEVGEACLGNDVDSANAILDSLGLERGKDGKRRLPDGRPLELVVETAGEDTEQVDMLDLVAENWKDIGFTIHTKPSERDVLRNRIFSGEALMTIWYGLENGVPTIDTPPNEFAPTSQYDQPQWSMWGQYHETKGQAGEAPQLPSAQRLLELYKTWMVSETAQEREAVWNEMLPLYAGECFTIGTVGNVMQPVAVNASLRNVPAEAIYNWEPHAQIGLYRPDTFWFDTSN